jgi:lipopolysaccharide transport system permease protein
VRYTITPHAVRLFATPVAYSSGIVPARWRPGGLSMAGVVEGFRWALLGKSEGPGAAAVSVLPWWFFDWRSLLLPAHGK